MSAVALLGVALLTVAGYLEVATRDGVVVLQREKATGIDLIAEGQFDAPPAAVLALLLDYERAPQFVKGVTESRILSRGPAELLVYQRLSLPIISDRDVTIRVTSGADGEVRWLAFKAANEDGPPPRSGIVRIPVDEGGWRLTPTADGKATRARYSVKLDLGGSLPRFIGKGRAGADIPALFETFRAQLRKKN